MREPKCTLCAKRERQDGSAYCEQCGKIKRQNREFSRFVRRLFQ